jgi:hypothetical protein
MARKNGKADAPEKRELEIIGTATSLADGLTYEATIVVELPNNQGMYYKLHTLTISEWNEIGSAVPQPQPPVSGFDGKQPIYNERDPGYLTACGNADLERNLRRLAAAVQIDIPGETLEEKAEALHKMDSNVARQLLAALLSLTFGGLVQIDKRADSFRPSANGHDESTEAVGDSAGE